MGVTVRHLALLPAKPSFLPSVLHEREEQPDIT